MSCDRIEDGKAIGCGDSLFELNNGLRMFIFPFEGGVFVGELVKRFSEVAEVWDETAIVADEAKKTLYLCEVLNGVFHSVTAVIFCGSIAMVPLEIMCPRYSTLVDAKSHFLSLQYHW